MSRSTKDASESSPATDVRKRKGGNVASESASSTPKKTKNSGKLATKASKSPVVDDSKGKLINAPDSSAPGVSFAQKLLKRVLVGVSLISAFTVIVLADHFYVGCLVILVQAIVFKEIISIRFKSPEARQRKVPWFRTMNWMFLAISFFYAYGVQLVSQFKSKLPVAFYALFVQYHLSISFALYVFAFCTFVLSLRSGNYKYQFLQMAWNIMTLVIVVAQASVLIDNIFHGLIWFLVPCCAIVFNDIMAFFCGVLFGNKIIKKQFLALSPNKTWEGFIGAAFFTVIFSYFLAGFLAQYKWFVCPKMDYTVGLGELDCITPLMFTPTKYILPTAVAEFVKNLGLNVTVINYVPFQLHALFFGLFASVVAPFGGFFTSGLKRAYNLKDFDNLFPGHGGMTDRMDCQMLMGLCVYVDIKTFVISAVPTVAQLLQDAALLSVDQQRELYSGVANLLGIKQ